jgi:hypothetical protein
MVERRVLILFFPMAFLLSWYPYILDKTHLVKTSGGINPLPYEHESNGYSEGRCALKK